VVAAASKLRDWIAWPLCRIWVQLSTEPSRKSMKVDAGTPPFSARTVASASAWVTTPSIKLWHSLASNTDFAPDATIDALPSVTSRASSSAPQ
jgi:hypothetical protein